MDGREFAPPPHLSHRGAGRMNPPTGHSAVQHPGHFQAAKYFSSPLPMATHTAGSGLMANSSSSFMGSFLSSSLGTAAASAHPAATSTSPPETTYRGPHGAGTSQIWFSHSHEGYPRFSASLASTFLPMSHLDHGNSNVLYGQHRFYESQKDNFYLRNLPAQPTLLSANHNFPSIARAAPGHPIGSCSRDRENSHLQKVSKDNERYLGGSELNKEKMGKGELKDRHMEEEVKERQKAVMPISMDGHCKEDMHQRGSCENRTKHLNSCLMTSKVLNGDPSKAMLSSCTVGTGMPRQGNQSRCAKDIMRSDRSYPQHEPQQPYSECLERRQMLHHSVSYTVPSSLPSIPAPLNTSSGSFPCLQLHSNPEVVCSLQDKTGRELKMGRPTFVPSVGHFTDKSRPFQVTPESCHLDRGDGKDKSHEMNSDPHLQGPYSNTFSHLKAEAKGDRRQEWHQNTATRIKNLEFLNSGGSDSAMQRGMEKGGYFDMPPSQDCPRPNHQDAHCVKNSQSCCTLDRAPKDPQNHGSQKVARIRHQQHRPSEMEQTGSGQDGKRKSIELSSLGYSGPHLNPWTDPPISISEERKNSYLDPFSTSLQQAALMTPGPALSQEMQGPTDEVSAMKNLLKYSNQALIVGQRAPFVGLGNMKASCSHQEMKFHSSKCQPEQERMDCARSRENESSHGDGEVRQPPVGIAVAVARQKDNGNRHEQSFGSGSSRQSRNNMGLKAGSGRSMHVIDLDAEEERSRLCDERLGIPGRDLLMQENKDLVEFARIHPSSGCPGDLTPHLMIAGGSSLQASQLGADPTTHTHPTHPHWLPRTRSPSIWMGGHSYGISHPALHQNLPPGFPPSMPSAMQPVFPLTQDPPAQLVILPPEPSPHTAPHPLADVMDQASLWPPMYPGRGPASHLQHPGQLPVYSRSQFLRQQELYALQQQRAAQALELQRQSHLQRKPEEHQQESEDHSDKVMKPQNKMDTLNASKSQTPPSLLLPPPSAPPPPKLSPCCHSPALRPPSKCPTPRPLAPCTLPACPDASSALVPSSPAVSPVPVQSSKGKEGEERRGEGQPPRDYPKSLEPDLPPAYTYPEVVRSYTSPTPHHVRSADPADPDTMQRASAAAEPEQSRTFTPSKNPPCDVPVSGDSLEAGQELANLGETDLSEICSQEPLESQEPVCEQESVAQSSLEEPQESTKEVGQVESLHEEENQVTDLVKAEDLTETSEEQLPNISEGPVATLGNVEEPVPETSEAQAVPEEVTGLDLGDTEAAEDEPTIPSPPSPPVIADQQDFIYNLDALIAASITLGEIPSLQDGESIFPLDSVSLPPSSGIHGIALLSELADLALQSRLEDTTKASADDAVISDLQVFATIAAAWSLAEAASLEEAVPGCHLPCCPSTAPRVRLSRRTYTWTPKSKPVCPLKAAIDQLDTQELDMRMKLAEIQRRYKEKQRELVKLQRRHDHVKEESSRSPARRGPGRPRKRPHCRAPSSHRPCDSKKSKSLNRSLTLLCSELRSEGEPKKKKIKISDESYSAREHSHGQVKVHCKKMVCQQNKLVSKLARKVSQLKSKALGSAGSAFRRKEALPVSKIQKKLPLHQGSNLVVKQSPEQKGQERFRPAMKSEGVDEDHNAQSESEDEEQDHPPLATHEPSLALHPPVNPSLIGPSPSSVVKMEANQKAKKKIERQGLLGSITSPENEVKIRKRSAKLDVRALPSKALRKKTIGHEGKPKVNLRRKMACDARMLTPSESLFYSSNQGLKKDKKGKDFQRKNGVLSLSLTPRAPKSLLKEGMKLGRIRSKQERGRAVSRLLQSFAVEDDFQFDDNSSFSEEEEETSPSTGGQSKERGHICSLSKEDLKEGLQVLIPKEDNLLYAASIRSLQPPDIYSVVIEGERGNRPRIYSQEQLLQEAVVDVRPQSTRSLPHGTRVCAYWSQKSRCLYPGNVVRGSSSDEGDSDAVTVAFDDGDRGKITLNNIRLLPPDFTIQCESQLKHHTQAVRHRGVGLPQKGTEPSPALLLSAESRRAKRSSGNTTASAESSQNQGPETTETPKNSGKKATNKEKNDKPDVFNSGAKVQLPANFLGRPASVGLLNWASQGRRRAGCKGGAGLPNPFQPQGSCKKQKCREPPHVFGNGFGTGSFSSLANSYTPFGGSTSTGLTPGQKPVRTKRGERTEEEDKGKGSKRKASGEFLVKLDHEGVMSPKTKNGKALLLCDKDFGLHIGQSYTPQTGLGKDRKRRPPLHDHLPIGLALGKFSGQAEYGVNCESDCPSSYSDQDEEDNEGGLRARVPSRFLAGLTVSSSSSGSSSSSSSGSLSSSSICSSDNEESSESSDEGDSTVLLQPCLTHPVPALLAQHPEDGGSGTRGCFVSGEKAKQRRKGTPSNYPKTKEPSPRQQRLPSVENRPKISAFLPARQLWKWSGEPTQRRGMKGKARKLFYKAIVRGKEALHVGDCAVFLSAGRPNLPYIGRIENMWESWGGNMVVKVKWFYHPEETKLGKRHSDGKNALYQSSHEDENDVQTISHKCQVVSRQQYDKMSHSKRYQDRQNLYYLAGTYDPGTGRLVTAEGVPVLC